MTASQLDNMLGLCEIGIERAYGRKPEWCSLEATRIRLSSSRRQTSMLVIFAFAGDEKTYALRGDSLSDLLGRISRECAIRRFVAESPACGRRVLVAHKADVVL